MAHESMRPYVQTREQVYRLLQAEESKQATALGYWIIATVISMVVALAASGAVSQTAWCFVLLFGMQWLRLMLAAIVRSFVMDLVTVHDVIRPEAFTPWGLVAELLKHTANLPERPNEARPAPSPGEGEAAEDGPANGFSGGVH